MRLRRARQNNYSSDIKQDNTSNDYYILCDTIHHDRIASERAAEDVVEADNVEDVVVGADGGGGGDGVEKRCCRVDAVKQADDDICQVSERGEKDAPLIYCNSFKERDGSKM